MTILKPTVGGRLVRSACCNYCGVEGRHVCPSCLRERLADETRRRRIGRVSTHKGYWPEPRP